jgi:hypothetical protein
MSTSAKSSTRPQLWHCDKCGAAGCVYYEPHAGTWEVIAAIGDAHAHSSPECPARLSEIRALRAVDAAGREA